MRNLGGQDLQEHGTWVEIIVFVFVPRPRKLRSGQSQRKRFCEDPFDLLCTRRARVACFVGRYGYVPIWGSHDVSHDSFRYGFPLKQPDNGDSQKPGPLVVLLGDPLVDIKFRCDFGPPTREGIITIQFATLWVWSPFLQGGSPFALKHPKPPKQPTQNNQPLSFHGNPDKNHEKRSERAGSGGQSAAVDTEFVVHSSDVPQDEIGRPNPNVLYLQSWTRSQFPFFHFFFRKNMLGLFPLFSQNLGLSQLPLVFFPNS